MSEVPYTIFKIGNAIVHAFVHLLYTLTITTHNNYFSLPVSINCIHKSDAFICCNNLVKAGRTL